MSNKLRVESLREFSGLLNRAERRQHHRRAVKKLGRAEVDRLVRELDETEAELRADGLSDADIMRALREVTIEEPAP